MPKIVLISLKPRRGNTLKTLKANMNVMETTELWQKLGKEWNNHYEIGYSSGLSQAEPLGSSHALGISPVSTKEMTIIYSHEVHQWQVVKVPNPSLSIPDLRIDCDCRLVSNHWLLLLPPVL